MMMEIYEALTSISELLMQIVEIEMMEKQRIEKVHNLEILKEVIEHSENIINENQLELENNNKRNSVKDLEADHSEDNREYAKIVDKLSANVANLKHENEKLQHQFINQKAGFENKIDKLNTKNKLLTKKVETLTMKIKRDAMELESIRKQEDNSHNYSEVAQQTPKGGRKLIDSSNILLSQFSTSPYLKKYQKSQDMADVSSRVGLTPLKREIKDVSTEGGSNDIIEDKTKLSKILKDKRKSLANGENVRRTGDVRKSISGDIVRGILNDFDYTESHEDSLKLELTVNKAGGKRKRRLAGNTKKVNLYGKDDEENENMEDEDEGATLLKAKKKNPFTRLMSSNSTGLFSPKPKRKNIFQI